MTTTAQNAILDELLKDTVVTVKFTKQSDGSERTMICTKNFALIPAADYPQQDSMPKVVNEDIMKVYDMEKCGWRSFRKDSIISYGV
jgi:hypothetical protein